VNWLFELADGFWPDWFTRAWAWFAMILGTLFVLIAAGEVIGHLRYGRVLLNAKTREQMTRRQIMFWAFLFGGAGLLFALLGLAVHRWKSG
jgi:hypothetical protein